MELLSGWAADPEIETRISPRTDKVTDRAFWQQYFIIFLQT